jgi:hypothetical protein
MCIVNPELPDEMAAQDEALEMALEAQDVSLSFPGASSEPSLDASPDAELHAWRKGGECRS